MALERAWATLDVKAAGPDRRTLTGIASTPTLDRQGHIFDIDGASFTNPIPLLLHHDVTQPIGSAILTKRGGALVFDATLPMVEEPGPLRDSLEHVRQLVTAGLLRGASIGFRVLEDGLEILKSGIVRIAKSEICELSLVTVPANREATILTVKSLDLAAMGHHPPGAAGLPVVSAVKSARPMTIAEQITQWSNTRAPIVAQMADLMDRAAQRGETLDAQEAETYDELKTKCLSVDAQITRLRDSEALLAGSAQPLVTAAAPAYRPVSVSVKPNVPPATAFIRMVQAYAVCKGDASAAAQYAERWRDSTPEVALVIKAAVAAGTTTDATWAGPLAPYKPMQDEFLEFLRPATIVGKIPNLRRVPFLTSVPSQTGGAAAQWVGEGAPKPVGALQFGTVTLGLTKCAIIVVITDELAKNSTPSAVEVIRGDLVRAIAYLVDTEFTLPARVAVANVSPGSITNGVTPITSAGTTPANGRTDIAAMISALVAAGLSAAQAVLLMSEGNAAALSNALNPLGQPLFPGLNITGGTGLGIPVITSQAVASNVILLHPPSILFADEGGVSIDVSREASLQMDGAPMSPPDATVIMTSLWQSNRVGIRAERTINWKKARAGCVQYVVQTYAA